MSDQYRLEYECCCGHHYEIDRDHGGPDICIECGRTNWPKSTRVSPYYKHPAIRSAIAELRDVREEIEGRREAGLGRSVLLAEEEVACIARIKTALSFRAERRARHHAKH